MKAVLILIISGALGFGIAAFMKNEGGSGQARGANSGSSSSDSGSRTVRAIGPAETISFVERTVTLSRCESYDVRETVARAGIVRASTRHDPMGRNKACPPLKAARTGLPVSGNPEHCYICPDGMTMLNLLRVDHDAVRARWNMGTDICISRTQTCR